MLDENQLQIYLLEEIIKKFERRADAVESLCDTLKLARDGVYRRLRSQSVVTPDEILLLARKYNISLDRFIFDKTTSVVWTFNAITRHVKQFEDYIESIVEDSGAMLGLPGAEVWYGTSEIPFFYYIVFPEIISFKLYVWGKTLWKFDYLQNRKYSLDIVPHHALDMAKKAHYNYRMLPSTELWSLSIMDNTLNQIEYHSISDGFENPEDALLLCDKMTELANHMENMALHGRKFGYGQDPELVNGGEFNLYYNEMIYTNNTIYVRSPSIRLVFAVHANPNFLRTQDERIADYTEDWFLSIRNRSTLISRQNEKARKWFFDRLRKRIDSIRTRIKIHLESD